MTTQENMADIKELLAKAKALGIKGAHFYNEDRLVAEIAKRESAPAQSVVEPGMVEHAEIPEKKDIAGTQPVRKIAPKMSVSGVSRDNGTRTIEKLDREHPEFKHMLQPKDIDPDVLEAKGLEFTGKTIGNEIVCRTDRESFIRWQNAQNEEHLKTMQSLDDEGQLIQAYEAQPKKPRDAK